MGDLRVSFGRHVNLYSNERALRLYAESRKRSIAKVEFDLSAVEWIGQLELSILVMWVGKLVAGDRSVLVKLPTQELLDADIVEAGRAEAERRRSRRVEAYSYMLAVRFIEFLLERRVVEADELARMLATRSPKLQSAPITPLRFLETSADLDSFLRSIRRQSAFVYGPAFDQLEAVRTGEVSDIVLQELGDNLFDHADGRSAHMLMTWMPGVTTERRDGFPNPRVRYAPLITRSFFLALGDAGYLSLVISDLGPGIAKTIRGAYEQDDILATRDDRPSEATLIDYAFLSHSSSKSEEQRLGQLLGMLEADPGDWPPATGLYWVMRAARRYRALMVVRSGKTLLAYDFLSYPETGHPGQTLHTNRLDKRMKDLSSFPGTQVWLCFPESQVPQQAFVAVPDGVPQADAYGHYEYFPLEAPVGSGPQDVSAWLDGQIRQVDTLRFRGRERDQVAVIDCDAWTSDGPAPLKALALLIVQLMLRQDRRFCVVIQDDRGLVDRVADTVSAVVTRAGAPDKLRPLIVIGRDGRAVAHGLSPDEGELLVRVLHGRENPRSLAELNSTLVGRVDHLVDVDAEDSRALSRISFERVHAAIAAGLKRGLADHILNPANRVFFEDGCFLIPSRAFSEGYFDVRRLLQDELQRSAVLRWLVYELPKAAALTVIAVGENMIGIAHDLQVASGREITVVPVRGAHDPSRVLGLTLLPPDSDYILLVDVIGTQRSLGNVLSASARLGIERVLALVDARQVGDDELLVRDQASWALRSIVRRPIVFHVEDKPRGYTYEEIVRVDPVSNSPLFEDGARAIGAIWKSVGYTSKVPFLRDVVQPTGAIFLGHFCGDNRHILYMIPLPQILPGFHSEITHVIESDIAAIREVDSNLSNHPISHVFFPRHTLGAELLAQSVAAQLESPHVVALSPQEIHSPMSYPVSGDADNVVIVDDATSSGYHVRRMLEIAESRGAKSILVYIVCNRGDTTETQLLRKITGYGKATVHVRFLADLPIPTFTKDDCPLCRWTERLSAVRDMVTSCEPLAEYVDAQLRRYERQPLASLEDAELVDSLASVAIDQRVQQAVFRTWIERARQSVPARRALAETARGVMSVSEDGVASHKYISLLRALDAERMLLLDGDSPYGEVFYEGLRRALSTATSRVLTVDAPVPDADRVSAARVLAAIDTQLLLGDVSRIPVHAQKDELLLAIFVELAMSQAARRQRDFIADAISGWWHRDDGLPPRLREAWLAMVPSAVASDRVFRCFRSAWFAVADSGALSQNLSAAIPYAHPKSWSGDVHRLGRAVRAWNAAYRELTRHLLPDLELLCALANSLPADHMQRQIARLSSLAQRVNELAQIMGDDATKLADRERAAQGAFEGMREIRYLALEEEADTIPSILKSFRTNLTALVKRVVDRRCEELDLQGISVELVPLSSPAICFGDEIALTSLVDHLLDNVRDHAFAGELDGERTCRIEITATEDEVRLTIEDNGAGGVPVPSRYGLGLAGVLDMTTQFCVAPLHLEEASPGLRATVRLYSARGLKW